MIALLIDLASNPAVLAILGAIGGIALAFFKGDRRGAARERDRHMRERQKARDVNDEIEDAIAGRSPEENRERLGRWSRR